ncbi:primase-helicase family protein [uncultured Roseobacter sp.]|uniref:primase-helicase family protein n=1 Tax=uncultured Roseobacter sp. TaxID=114847 RepID=UPI002621751A|nr:primase-helicase family protein [uncultured Roseobacter sp.]
MLDGDQLNLWSGFGVRPKAGDWSLMRQHITDVLAAGDEASADYIIKWAAYAVQHPDRPAEAALVFRGELGTGKGMFGRAMLRIFGRHGVRTQGAQVLDSRFNAHLRDCCLLFADEVDWDSRRSSAQLKGMVTEESLFIEPKGVDATNQPNYLHIIIASNNEWVIPAAPGERRFAVFGVHSHRKKEKAYWRALQSETDNGGLAAMLHDLLEMDLDGWHPRDDIPQTGELSDQKLAGLSGADAVVREVLMGAVGAGVERPAKGADRAIMVRPLIRWAIDNRIVAADPGEKRMGTALRRMGCERVKLTIPNKGQKWVWTLPPLAEARATWAKNLGLTVAWPDDEDWADFPG